MVLQLIVESVILFSVVFCCWEERRIARNLWLSQRKPHFPRTFIKSVKTKSDNPTLLFYNRLISTKKTTFEAETKLFKYVIYCPSIMLTPKHNLKVNKSKRIPKKKNIIIKPTLKVESKVKWEWKWKIVLDVHKKTANQ